MSPLENSVRLATTFLNAIAPDAVYAPGIVTIVSGANGLQVTSGSSGPVQVVDNPPAAFMPVRFQPFTLEPGPTVQFDEDGYPRVIAGSTGVFQTNPTTIAQWGLGAYARGEWDTAKKAADWLLAHQDAQGGFPLLFEHTNNPADTPAGAGYHLTPPWHSAVTQGNSMSLLIRMWKVTGDIAYRVAAERALDVCDTLVADGGIQGTLNGKPWFEETPDPTYPNHILNGSVFCLLGIGDVATIAGNPKAIDLWTRGEDSLRSNINAHIVWHPLAAGAPSPLPDPWMVYDLQVNGFPVVPNYLTDFYGEVHCELFEEMATRTGQDTYRLTAQSLRASLTEYINNPPTTPAS